MAKSKTVFVCNECGYESAKWLGKCPACGSWNSFFEEKIAKETSKGLSQGERIKNITPKKLNEVQGKEDTRVKTGIGELDRVLGGGLVKGSLVLVGGEPGIGKSTLILELCIFPLLGYLTTILISFLKTKSQEAKAKAETALA